MGLLSKLLRLLSGSNQSGRRDASVSSHFGLRRKLIIWMVLGTFSLMSFSSFQIILANTGHKTLPLDVTTTVTCYLPLIAKGCNLPVAPFNQVSGAVRGVFEGGLPGDSGRTRLGTFDAQTGLRHYLINFYWRLEDESVTNGSPTIASFAKQVWSSNRLPVLHIRTQAFVDNATGLSPVAVTRLNQFASWLRNDYTGQIAVSLFPEMNLVPAPYCPSSWDAATCVRVFKTAFQFASNTLLNAAPNRVHIGLNYNMRFLTGSSGGTGARYADWQLDRAYYDWVGYNIFVHACKNGARETTDPWFLMAAMQEPGNDFYQTFCTGGACGSPCIIAETAASDSCSSGYQNWWLDRFAIGSDPGQPYFNIYLPEIKGYVWFNQNNGSLGGWEENWQIQDYNSYRAIFNNSYFRDAP